MLRVSAVWGDAARRVWSDSKGRIWVAEWDAGQVGLFDPAMREWQEWRLPGDAPMAYSSAKAAVVNLTRAAAVELADQRIRVNCLCPGGIHTPLMRIAIPVEADQAFR